MIYDYEPNVDLAMTTNAFLLKGAAQKLKDAGLKRINVSIDTLKPEIAKKIAQKDVLKNVLAGVNEALKVGLKVKANMVPMKTLNAEEIIDVLEYCKERNISVRFIEYMEKHKAKINTILGSEVESSNHQIEVCVSHPDDVLEIYRNKELAQVWRLFIEGYWGQDEYHMGFIEYSVARCVDGMWLMNACSRYECLDNVTRAEVDENQLTADQAQAIFDHGSLEAAQQFRYNRLVAASSAFEGQMNSRLAGEKLYEAVIAAGGNEIHDDYSVY